MAKIIGSRFPDMPWQEPEGGEVMWRYSANPVIGRNPVPGVSRIFNSAIVPYKGGYIGIFRGDTTSCVPYLYLGRSRDGVHFEFDEKRIEFICGDGKPYKLEYAYDPRLVAIDGVYYIVWCDGMDGSPTLGLGRTRDFVTFEMLGHPLLPFNRNGVLFPRKINGEYAMLSRPSDSGHTPFGDIYVSRSRDLVYWGKHELVMRTGSEWWQSLKIGAGCVPIETDEGWLLFYHGTTRTCSGFVYSMGAALLDIDTLKVKARSTDYMLTPEEQYETVGFVPNVVFPCAALTDSDTGRIAVYYGSADTYVSLAFTTVDRVLAHIKNNK